MTTQVIQKLEESLWISKTRFDRAYMENILSEGFFEFGRSGKTYQRQEILDAPPQEIKATLPLQNFQFYEVAEGVIQTTYISEVMYGELETSNRSSMWIDSKDGWKLRFHQGTSVSNIHGVHPDINLITPNKFPFYTQGDMSELFKLLP